MAGKCRKFRQVRGSMWHMSKAFTAAVHQEEDWYVAQCLEIDVASQGSTMDEAVANLSEAVGLYLVEVDNPRPTSRAFVTLFEVTGAV
jgi:predicted RNase H-like HicB family nuclease